MKRRRGRPRIRVGPLLRNPDAQYPVGVISEIGDVEVVAVRHCPDLPGFAEDPSNPVVYAACSGRGRKTPSDLFYLRRNPNRPCHGFRVYIREVQKDG